MRILGIDPGYAIVGYGVIDYDGYNYKVIDYGVIESSKDEMMAVRMAIVYDGISELIDKYSPDAISIEQLFYFKNHIIIYSDGETFLYSGGCHVRFYSFPVHAQYKRLFSTGRCRIKNSHAVFCH